jgi:hypothetical protein
MHLCGAPDVILALLFTVLRSRRSSSVSSVHQAAVSPRGMIFLLVTNA